MGRKHTLSKRPLRFIGGAIAGFVVAFIAMNALSQAEAQTCSLQDTTAWQLLLNDREIEQTPEHIRSVTEAFLETCPQRPEFAKASQIAGIAAADLGDASAAAAHFQNSGQLTEIVPGFYAIAAYHASGSPRAAWAQRDYLVGAWQARLDRHPMVNITPEETAHGTIYRVDYLDQPGAAPTPTIWVAVPSGAGWPVSLSVSNDPFLNSLQRVRASQNDRHAAPVELNRCQERRRIGEFNATFSASERDASARASLIAYLAAPDVPRRSDRTAGAPCVWPQRLLPGPPTPRR